MLYFDYKQFPLLLWQYTMGKGFKDRQESCSYNKNSDKEMGYQVNESSRTISKKSQRHKKKYMEEEDEVQEYLSKKECEVCHRQDKEHQMLLCDRCDDSYHLGCLDPPIHELPENQWICPACEQQLVILNSQKQIKAMSFKPQTECFKCKQHLNRREFIKGRDQNGNSIEIQCKSLVDLTCLFCKHSFHNVCFSERKNSVNCRSCEVQIRKNGPKSHDQFMKYIDRSIEEVKNSDHWVLQEGIEHTHQQRHRYFRLKVPAYITSWNFIVQYQASLYYSFATKRLTFIDDQIYLNQDRDQLLKINHPSRDCHDSIFRLHEKDEKVYEQFKVNSKKGFVGPFEVKEDRIKGFYLVATDYIEPYTIISEYVGEVMKARKALNYEQNDSIFMLIRGHRSSESLDIVPEKYGNISRFFSGINNSVKRSLWSKLQNIKSLRFSYKGRVHLLLHTVKPVQAGETLYFDYNGSAFQEYPTEHFVE